jgi:hypothetical protein
MNDAEKRIKALYHLEVCFEPFNSKGERKPLEMIEAHITAAHYLIQSMAGGPVPFNYDEVMEAAAQFDAADEANCAIQMAKSK